MKSRAEKLKEMVTMLLVWLAVFAAGTGWWWAIIEWGWRR